MKLLLADDHLLTLQGIRSVLEEVDDIKIVAETRSGAEVPRLVDRTKPDMLVMDVRMPGLDGLAVLDIVRRHNPEVKVVLLSAYGEPRQIQDALERGATAYADDHDAGVFDSGKGEEAAYFVLRDRVHDPAVKAPSTRSNSPHHSAGARFRR